MTVRMLHYREVREKRLLLTFTPPMPRYLSKSKLYWPLFSLLVFFTFYRYRTSFYQYYDLDSDLHTLVTPSPLEDSTVLEKLEETWTRYDLPEFDDLWNDLTSPLPPTLPQLKFGNDCLDLWTSKGRLCSTLINNLEIAKNYLDVISVWSNGTDDRSILWRLALAKGLKPPFDHFDEKDFYNLRRDSTITGSGIRNYHFRTHNELIYSLRSFYKNLPLVNLKRILLLTPDLPSLHSTVDGRERWGMIPQWLNFSVLNGDLGLGLKFQLKHDSMFFKLPRQFKENLDRVKIWRESVSPSYNS